MNEYEIARPLVSSIDSWIDQNTEDKQLPNMIENIQNMLAHYGFSSSEMTKGRLDFRLKLLEEEFNETIDAKNDKNAEELVDGLIDIIVIAIGTLELSGVNVGKAWSAVYNSNMKKLRGSKEGRPSDGWDLYKPEGWTSPSHIGNHGQLEKLFNGD